MPTLAYTVSNGKLIAGNRRKLADALIQASGAGVNHLHPEEEEEDDVPRRFLTPSERRLVEDESVLAITTTDAFTSLFSPTYDTIHASSYVGKVICCAYEEHVRTRHEVAQNLGFCSWLEVVLASLRVRPSS